MVNRLNFLAHTQPERYFNFHLPPTFSAAGLSALPPCCTLSVMFSRRQSSLSNLSHPAPRLFLAQDTFRITADVTGTTCHSRAHLVLLCPFESPRITATLSPVASSAQGPLQRETTTWAGEKEAAYVSCCQEGERTNILPFGTGTQQENSQRKKAAKEQKHESPFTQVKWHLFSQPLTQLLWLTALLVTANMYWKGHFLAL